MTDTKQPEAPTKPLAQACDCDQFIESGRDKSWRLAENLVKQAKEGAGIRNRSLACKAAKHLIAREARIAALEAENSALKGELEAIDAGGVTGLPDAQPFRSITWPKGREAGRMGDMTPLGESHMRVGFDSDNDVYVSVFNQACGAGDIEFCTYGQGGGKSPRTREALIALMVAMEEDSKETPSFRFPPGAAIAQEGGR